MTPEQYNFLTRGIQESRVQNLRGQSHLEAWDVRRHLLRAFGYGGWDLETKSLDLVRELDVSNGGKPRWTVVYRAEVRLTIKTPTGEVLARYEDAASGDSQNQPSLGDAHDMAMKTALSQALKRTAVNLGDQFGLSLYNGGSAAPVVHRSLVTPDGVTAAAPPADPEPVQPEPAPAAAEPDAGESAPAPAAAAEGQPKPPASAAPDPVKVRDWALDKDHSTDGLRKAAHRLEQEHPDVAAATVTSETGDEERLVALMRRKARELAPGGDTEQTNDGDYPDRRRKRMQALLTEHVGNDRSTRLHLASSIVGREITSTSQLSDNDVERLITALETSRPTATTGATA